MSADPASVLAWREELSALEMRLGELFVRAEPRRQAGLYREGLMSAAKRKNGWQPAEQIGDARPWRTQRVLSHVLWDQDAARDLCRGYAVEHLGAADGVLIVDETGFLKKGEHSAGVVRQDSGTTGRYRRNARTAGSRPSRSAMPGPGAPSGCSATCCGTRMPPGTCAAATPSSTSGRRTAC